MAFSPLQILSLWLRGLVAALVIVVSVYCAREWYNRSHVRTDTGVREDRRASPYAPHRFDPAIGFNVPTVFLTVAALTAVWSFGGGLLLTRLRRRASTDPAERRHLTHGRYADAKYVRRADGSNIYTESAGPIDAPVLLLVHGWGGTAEEWNVLRPHVDHARHRVVRYDLAGLGRTEAPRDRDFSLDRMAQDLRLVLEGAVPTGRPVVLVGHSIGAMTLLTFARRFPELLRVRVAGMVLAHGTYTNPIRTHEKAELLTKLQKPLVEPLCYAAIPLSPLLRVLSWASYLNGSTHRSTRRSGFSDGANRTQIDFAASFAPRANVAAVARGALGMFRWDATDVPPRLDVPVLYWAGEKDPTTLPEASRRMYEQSPRATSDLHTRLAAKHLGPIEFHADFARRITEFADACFEDRPPEHRTLITPAPPAASQRPVTARAPGAESDGGAAGLTNGKTEPDRVAEPASSRDRAFDGPSETAADVRRGDGLPT
jgi:pimeloyl-ACP methyl ester carboxylesterase